MTTNTPLMTVTTGKCTTPITQQMIAGALNRLINSQIQKTTTTKLSDIESQASAA